MAEDVIHCGDCLDWLPTLAAGAATGCVTDPPYGLRFMGREWDGAVTVTAEAAQVTLAEIARDEDGRGFVINGAEEWDRAGLWNAGAGDVNGDGLEDVIVGVPGDFQNDPGPGAAYVVFGRAGGAAVELSDLDAGQQPAGFVINGVDDGDATGISVHAAGDVNGDGLADVIVGAFYADGRAGASYVVFGKTDAAAVDLSDVAGGNGDAGFLIEGVSTGIEGVSTGDLSGFSVSGGGDVNGDGLDDLVIGAFGADRDGKTDAGEAYVVFGKTDGGAVALSALDPDSGIVIRGAAEGDWAGYRSAWPAMSMATAMTT